VRGERTLFGRGSTLYATAGRVAPCAGGVVVAWIAVLVNRTLRIARVSDWSALTEIDIHTGAVAPSTSLQISACGAACVSVLSAVCVT